MRLCHVTWHLRDASADRHEICRLVRTKPYFIMLSKILGAHLEKNFGCEKHAKLGTISDDFEIRRRISPKQMKIF